MVVMRAATRPVGLVHTLKEVEQPSLLRAVPADPDFSSVGDSCSLDQRYQGENYSAHISS